MNDFSSGFSDISFNNKEYYSHKYNCSSAGDILNLRIFFFPPIDIVSGFKIFFKIRNSI